jgi:hypothetical protein
MVLSSALVCSTGSPVSVWGTVCVTRSCFLEVAGMPSEGQRIRSVYPPLRHMRVPTHLLQNLSE